VDVDPLWLVARLGPMVAGCGVVSGETRNSVHDKVLAMGHVRLFSYVRLIRGKYVSIL